MHNLLIPLVSFSKYNGNAKIYAEQRKIQNKSIFSKKINLKSQAINIFRFNWNTPITVTNNQPNRIYIGSQFLHKSEDMGDTWEIISPDLTTNDPKKQKQEVVAWAHPV